MELHYRVVRTKNDRMFPMSPIGERARKQDWFNDSPGK